MGHWALLSIFEILDTNPRTEGVRLAAELLYISEHTVMSWLKPKTSKSSNEIPLMAIELLEFKLKATRTTR
jgi:hypothetical protein